MMKLEFPKEDLTFAQSLSAVVKVGGDLWVGGDEGTKLVGLRQSRAGGAYRKFGEIDLVAEFDLPGKPAKPGGDMPEVDIEGLDWDEAGGYLWVIGSHSMKRNAASFVSKKGFRIEDEENLKRLGKVTADGNRYLLGRLPMRTDARGKSGMVPHQKQSKAHFRARLDCTQRSSDLLKALRGDPLLEPFLSKKRPLPGKDNGLDFEGLAWDGKGGRLIVGLRGPVLRGMAILLEIQVEEDFRGVGKVGRLELTHDEHSASSYRRHFLDLDGLGVRDLCFRGDDLLVLAGPTMPIDWPVTIYSWKGARHQMDGGERFGWQEDGSVQRLIREELPETERKRDRPEAITLWKDNKILVVCDAPSSARLVPPATVRIEEFQLG